MVYLKGATLVQVMVMLVTMMMWAASGGADSEADVHLYGNLLAEPVVQGDSGVLGKAHGRRRALG